MKKPKNRTEKKNEKRDTHQFVVNSFLRHHRAELAHDGGAHPPDEEALALAENEKSVEEQFFR